MSIDPREIATIVNLNGGKIVGKTRLQKTFYFLEALNSGFGVDFQYYHYGPYSEDLSIATDDAIALNVISVEWKTGSNAPYAIFRSDEGHSDATAKNTTDMRENRTKILNILEKYDSICLELAATADFLSKAGFSDNPWAETKIRKSTKATDDRVLKAKSLLSELKDLNPA